MKYPDYINKSVPHLCPLKSPFTSQAYPVSYVHAVHTYVCVYIYIYIHTYTHIHYITSFPCLALHCIRLQHYSTLKYIALHYITCSVPSANQTWQAGKSPSFMGVSIGKSSISIVYFSAHQVYRRVPKMGMPPNPNHA